MDNTTLNYIKNKISNKPKVCILLGSGLDSFITKINNKNIISYNDIPNFHKTSVEGHKGEFITGYINNTPVLCARGRFHYYEGFSFKQIGSIIEIFSLFNPKLSIITNSSGCLNTNWDIGNFMLANEFLDFSFIESINIKKYIIRQNKYYKNSLKVALKNNISLYQGTYSYTTGPTYETKAEIKEIINVGGDAVGMSTFPEFLKCKELKMDSIFLSCLTNYGAGLVNEKINHEDVLKNASKAKNKFCRLLVNIIENIELQKKSKI